MFFCGHLVFLYRDLKFRDIPDYVNIPVKISAKLFVNFQHNIKYRNYANEAVKAAKLTWKLIHV